MESYADGMINFLLSVMKKLVAGSSGLLMGWYESGFLNWITEHWKGLTIFLIVLGVLVDQVVWLFRWRPYYRWMRSWQHLVNGFRKLGDRVRDPSRAGEAETLSAQREDVRRRLTMTDEESLMLGNGNSASLASRPNPNARRAPSSAGMAARMAAQRQDNPQAAAFNAAQRQGQTPTAPPQQRQSPVPRQIPVGNQSHQPGRPNANPAQPRPTQGNGAQRGVAGPAAHSNAGQPGNRRPPQMNGGQAQRPMHNPSDPGINNRL